MNPIRLGCVKYLNTLPLIEGLQSCQNLELLSAVPSRLADMLHAGEVDVALVSLVDAARSAEPLALIPAGMIGCDGPTLTVRLFSTVPFDQVEQIAADTDSHTSTALAQVVLWKALKRRVKVVDFDARERTSVVKDQSQGEWPPTLLMIGDKVVTDSPPAVRYPHQMDLGAAWRELTGLPFVYAVWMCAASRMDDPSVRIAAALLERQRLHNRTRTDWIVSARAKERQWPEDLARTYLGSLLRYDVTDRSRQAVELFLQWAAELGLAKPSVVRWADDAVALAR